MPLRRIAATGISTPELGWPPSRKIALKTNWNSFCSSFITARTFFIVNMTVPYRTDIDTEICQAVIASVVSYLG